jgi:guanylate kinase
LLSVLGDNWILLLLDTRESCEQIFLKPPAKERIQNRVQSRSNPKRCLGEFAETVAEFVRELESTKANNLPDNNR